MQSSIDRTAPASPWARLQERFERARQRPVRQVAADGVLLLGLLAIVTLDLRGRMGWVLLGGFLALHLFHVRTSQRNPSRAVPKER